MLSASTEQIAIFGWCMKTAALFKLY